MLQSLKSKDYDIYVAALSDAYSAVEEEIYEGLRVYRIPSVSDWVSLVMVAGRRVTGGLPLIKRLAGLEAALRYLFPRHASRRGFRERFEALRLYRDLSRSQRGGWMPLMDADMLDRNPARTALAGVIEQVRPDFIHADNYRSIMLAADVAPAEMPLVAFVRDNRFFCAQRDQTANIGGMACADCRLACVSHSGAPNEARLQSLMRDDLTRRSAALARATRIVVTSRFLKRQIEAVAPGRAVSVVANPSDSLDFVRACQVGVRKADPPEILVVGMINANKGQARAPEWIKAFSEALPDFRLVLAGRGQLVEKIRAEVKALGCSDRLVTPGFLGRVELYRAYARASVIMMPNIWPEPFGRVPLEAAMSARPVVAYASGGPVETVVDGETGRLVPPQDEAGLIQAVIDLVKDAEQAGALGRAAFHRVQEVYSVRNAVHDLAGVWSGVIDERQSSAPMSFAQTEVV